MFAFIALSLARPQVVPRYAHMASPEITESSGLVASHRYPGEFWTHNDSGDTARLYLIGMDGRLVGTRTIEGATNGDWEDIAIDGETIWIDDAGNNGNARRDLCLYSVPERGGKATRYGIRYPDQTEFPPKRDRWFDCEALFIRGHKPYLITKWRFGSKLPGFGASLYRLDTRRTDRDNLLTKLDTKADFGGWVTAADLSPNGKELAVLVHLPVAAIWIFDATKGEKLLLHPIARRVLGEGLKQEEGQIESLAWTGEGELVFGNEGGDLFRVARRAIPPLPKS